MIRLVCAALLLVAMTVGPVSAQLTVVQQWPTGTFPGGLAYDSERDHIWLVNNSTGEVREYTRTGTMVGMFLASDVGLTWPIGIDFEEATGHLWICDEYNPEQVVECTRDGVAISNFSVDALMQDCSGLAYCPMDDYLYIADDNASEVVIWTKTGTYMDRWSSMPVVDTDAICYMDGTNTLLVGDDNGAMIYEFTLDGTVLNSWNLISLLGIQGVDGLAYDAATANVFIGDSTTGAQIVYEVSGFHPPSPVESASWGKIKSLFQ